MHGRRFRGAGGEHLNRKPRPTHSVFDAPLDAWYAWFGVAAVSIAVFGVAAALPATPAPDAAAAAETVDAVAAGEYPATAEHDLAADEFRLRPRGVAIRNDGGTARASFAFGPITPTVGDGRLQRVLDGEPPARVFDSATTFQQAIVDARAREPRWRTAPDELRIRQVHWEGIRVTLVG